MLSGINSKGLPVHDQAWQGGRTDGNGHQEGCDGWFQSHQAIDVSIGDPLQKQQNGLAKLCHSCGLVRPGCLYCTSVNQTSHGPDKKQV